MAVGDIANVFNITEMYTLKTIVIHFMFMYFHHNKKKGGVLTINGKIQ